MRILVIDSEFERRRKLQFMIRSIDYDINEIVGVGILSAAYYRMRQEEFGGVFLMAESHAFDWLTILRDIRNRYDYDTLPVVLLIKDPTKQDVMDAYQEGANGVLRYPCRIDHIKRMIHLIKTSPKPEPKSDLDEEEDEYV